MTEKKTIGKAKVGLMICACSLDDYDHWVRTSNKL